MIVALAGGLLVGWFCRAWLLIFVWLVILAGIETALLGLGQITPHQSPFITFAIAFLFAGFWALVAGLIATRKRRP